MWSRNLKWKMLASLYQTQYKSIDFVAKVGIVMKIDLFFFFIILHEFSLMSFVKNELQWR